MDLIKFLKDQYEEYLRAFENVKSNLVTNGFFPITEPIDREVSPSLELFPLFRYDLLIPQEGEDALAQVNVEVTPTTFANHESFKFKSLDVIIKSFVWNSCQLHFSDDVRYTNLLFWYKEAIDESNEIYDSSLKNVIHSLTPIDGKTLVIDFGTIHFEKALNLFRTLEMSGVRKIMIESIYE